MVAIREAKRAVRGAATARLDGTPPDTSPQAQTVQDTLVRFMSPAEKLAQVARLSRMVNSLGLEGIQRRHPSATRWWIRMRLTEERLGRELTRKAYGWSSD